MRVTAIINRFPPHHSGGYELRFEELLGLLRKRGHRTSVVTSTHGVGRPVIEKGGVHRVLSLRGETHGVRGILGLARATRIDSDRLRAALAEERPEVVLVGNFFELTSGLWSVLRRGPAPLVLDVSNRWLEDLAGTHGNWFRIWEKPAHSPLAGALKKLLRAFVRAAPGFRVPTRWPGLGASRIYGTARHVIASAAEVLGKDDPEPILRPSGIDLEAFPYRPSDRPIRRLLYVGRLSRLKGVHTTIEAMRRLEGTRLTIVGIEKDRAYEAELREMAEPLGDRVEFRPAVPRSELTDVYAEHDVLLFPTTGPEAFSRLILEAMSSGLPVVATPNGGTGETIDDGQNGLLYPAGDAAALATCVERLRGDESLRRSVVEIARARVEERYDLAAAVGRIEDLLLEAIAEVGTVTA